MVLYTDADDTNEAEIRATMEEFCRSRIPEEMNDFLTAKTAKANIIVVDTPRGTHSGDGYPFFYDIKKDTLYIGNNESLHLELIEAAGIDMMSSDYLYDEGGDAGYALGFLSGRVGAPYHDADHIEIFEGNENMFSREVRQYLLNINRSHTPPQKISRVLRVQWIDLVNNNHGFGLPFILSDG